MSQQVQDLINKIKSEGIDAADKKAKEIVIEAQGQAKNIITQAQEDAARLINDAEAEINKKKLASEKAIKQAARDTLLDLRKEIERVLNKIVLNKVAQSLTPEQLSQTVGRLIEKSFDLRTGQVQDIRVSLSPEDLNHLHDSFVAGLQERFKGGVEFQSNQGVSKGFTISFDGGKSSFEFTDASLTDYLSAFLNPEIAALIKNGKI